MIRKIEFHKPQKEIKKTEQLMKDYYKEKEEKDGRL